MLFPYIVRIFPAVLGVKLFYTFFSKFIRAFVEVQGCVRYEYSAMVRADSVNLVAHNRKSPS